MWHISFNSALFCAETLSPNTATLKEMCLNAADYTILSIQSMCVISQVIKSSFLVLKFL